MYLNSEGPWSAFGRFYIQEDTEIYQERAVDQFVENIVIQKVPDMYVENNDIEEIPYKKILFNMYCNKLSKMS